MYPAISPNLLNKNVIDTNANTVVPVFANNDIINVFCTQVLFLIASLNILNIISSLYPPCTTTFAICLFIILLPMYVSNIIQHTCNISIFIISPAELIYPLYMLNATFCM